MTKKTQEISRPDKGYVFALEDGRPVIRVLCGGIAMYEIAIALNPEEQAEFEERGEEFLDELADGVLQDPSSYHSRHIG